MARALRNGGTHRATAELGLHVLDAMLATTESVDSRAFISIKSLITQSPAVPEDWDPTRREV
jgi:hypothetical protein